MARCPCCGTQLIDDYLYIEAGGYVVTRGWVSGCPGCGWEPGDPIERRRPRHDHSHHDWRSGTSASRRGI